MGDLIAEVLVAKVLKTSDTSPSAVICRVFRGPGQHMMGAKGRESEEPPGIFLLLGLVGDDGELHSHGVQGAVHCLGQDVVISDPLYHTVQLSIGSLPYVCQRNQFYEV